MAVTPPPRFLCKIGRKTPAAEAAVTSKIDKSPAGRPARPLPLQCLYSSGRAAPLASASNRSSIRNSRRRDSAGPTFGRASARSSNRSARSTGSHTGSSRPPPVLPPPPGRRLRPAPLPHNKSMGSTWFRSRDRSSNPDFAATFCRVRRPGFPTPRPHTSRPPFPRRLASLISDSSQSSNPF